MEIGDRVRCVAAGSTLLKEGRLYTVSERWEIDPVATCGGTKGDTLYGVKELPRVLWGSWRFTPTREVPND
jgi:hypothetical protein